MHVHISYIFAAHGDIEYDSKISIKSIYTNLNYQYNYLCICGSLWWFAYFNGVWVKCVTRTRVGKPALGFYESLKNIFGSKINAVKA